MDIRHTYWFYRFLQYDHLSYFYQGVFNDDITDWLISLSQKNIENVQDFSKLKKKVSFLMAECFQNIIRHIDDNKAKIKQNTGLFMARNIGSTYYIASSNTLKNDEIANLKQKLEEINTLDKSELKQAYLDILTAGGLSDKGGAGLGLIEMARKSGQKLEYDFREVDDDTSFFYLQVKLIKEKENQAKERIIPISLVKQFHEEMTKDNILLVYKGDFSQEAIIPVLKMFENNIQNEIKDFNLKKKAYHIVVETLQNISKHAYEINNTREGMFLIGKTKDRYVLNAGNLIKREEEENIKNRLDKLNNTNPEDLRKLYIEALKKTRMKEGLSAGLGFIDIARESKQQISYRFDSIDNELSFFSIKIKI